MRTVTADTGADMPKLPDPHRRAAAVDRLPARLIAPHKAPALLNARPVRVVGVAK